MATLAGGQVKLNNGQTITPQNGGWYDAQQFFNGQLGAPGQDLMHGGNVSDAVIAQTNPNNVAYVHQQQTSYAGGSSTPIGNSGGSVSGSGGGAGGGVFLPTAPTFDLVAATDAAYNTPEIKAAQKAITDRQAALATAQSNINDNPFYSEATRVGKSAKLTDAANNDIAVQQNLLTRLNAEAAIKVGAQQGQYNINEKAYQDTLTNFQNLVSMGALDNASGDDIARLAAQTGISPSMIESIQAVSKAKNNPVEKPQIVTSTDNEGNLSILAVDPSTGAVINQSQIAGVGKASKKSGGSGGGGGGSAADQNAANVLQDAQNKVTLKQLVQHYGSAVSIDKIYQIYAANSPYGAPKETLAEAKKGQFASN